MGDPYHSELRRVAIASGVGWSILFVVLALHFELQKDADGSLFSYAIAVRESWAFHWHNISSRVAVYLFSLLPAEIYVALTNDAKGGIVAYGFLFYVAQILGLAATWIADRSAGRIIFTYACASTACLCPLVLGMPTETWMTHALFWPSLAFSHYARQGLGGFALTFTALLALVLTHDGAVILAVVILATLSLRGLRDPLFVRAAVALGAAMTVWLAVRAMVPPDDYFAEVLIRAAVGLLDVRRLMQSGLFVLLSAALTAYGVIYWAARRRMPATSHIAAAAIVAAGLAAYWLWFGHTLDTEDRYRLRVILLMASPALGAIAAAYALQADGTLRLRIPGLPGLLNMLSRRPAANAAIGAILLVTLTHAVETAKFVRAWSRYMDAVRTLAMGTASDPQLGSGQFVSSSRIDADLNRLAWNSTTPYLSVLVAPGFAPKRLVVDPGGNYFWLTCTMATENQKTIRAIPAASRELVRIHACLHR